MHKNKKKYNKLNAQIVQNYLVKYNISTSHLSKESQQVKIGIIQLIILMNHNLFPLCLFFTGEYEITRQGFFFPFFNTLIPMKSITLT